MALIDQLRADLLEARKAHNDIKSGLLTALVGEAAMVGKNNGNRETTDEEALKVVKKFLDNAKETRGLLAERNATEALAKIEAEITVLEAYMPNQLSEAELRGVIAMFKMENPGANIGAIMKHLASDYAGRYDGKMASIIAREA